MANEFKIKNGLYVSGSTTVTNNTIITGSLNVLGGITGSLLGTASYASNSDLLDGLDSTSFVTTSSFDTTSGSLSTRVTDLETASGSFSTRVTTAENNITNLQNASSSFSTRVTSAENSIVSIQGATSSYATTGSNNFVGTQYISATNNAIGFTTTASLYTDGGIRVAKDMYVSGNAYFNNVTIYGTQSVQYITSSQLNISTNLISVNTDTPTIRFGGLAVYDSGSTGLSGSLLWDSEQNHWVYSNPSGSTYSGGMLISGPRASSLGTEQGTTACTLMMGQGGDHITSSAIFHYGNTTCFYGNSYITSSGGAYFSGNVGVGLENPIAKLEASKFQGHGLRINYCTDQSVSAGAACQGGIYAVNCGLNGYPLIVDEVSSNVTGGQYPVLIRSLASAGTPAAGMATGIHFGVPDNASNVNVAQMAFRTTDADSGTYTMRWEMRMKNLNTYQTNFMVLGDGSLALGTNGTAPSYRLDVSGCARITGDACFGGMSIVASCLGVGTATPNQKLQVYDATVARILVGTNTTFTDPYSAFPAQNISAIQVISSNVGGAQLQLGYTNTCSGCGIGGIHFMTTGTSASEKRGALIASELEASSATNVTANLVFYTNITGTIGERMRIASTGQVCFACTICAPMLLASGCVGIGTTLPAARLHVNGSIGSPTYKGFVYTYLGSETLTDEVLFQAVVNGYTSNVPLYLFKDQRTDQQTTQRIFEIQGGRSGVGTILTTLANGNVGIGTTDTQSFRLAVNGANVTQGDANTTVRIFDTTSATTGTGGGISFGGYFCGTSSVANTLAFIQGGKENSTADNFASFLRFGTRINNGDPTERMRITSAGIACFACQVCMPVLLASGCVGIGTTSISSTYGTLTVAGTGISIADDGNAKLQIGRYSTAACNAYIKMGTNACSLRFTNAADTVDVVVMEKGGNVGIGTSSPGTALEISSTAASADRTLPHNVLTITALQGNAPYGPFGGSILFKNSSYVTGVVCSARIRSVIYDDGAPYNCGGGLWFETTPTPGGSLTPSLKIDYRGQSTFNSSFYDVAAFNSTYGQSGISIQNNGTSFAVFGSGVSVTATAAADDVGIGTAGLAKSIVFATGTGYTERMRINASGDLELKGRSTTTNYQAVFYNDNAQLAINATNTSTGKAINFNPSSTFNAFSIAGTGIACFACQVCAPIGIFSTCVGINVTSPDAPLRIHGGAGSTSTVIIAGGSVGNDNATISAPYSMVFQVDNTGGVGGRSFSFKCGGKGYSDGTTLFAISPTGNVTPGANGTQDLGSSSLRWCTVYTSDLSLNNGIGNYTIVEGENDLFLYNNNSCKVFKFLLQEVCPEIAPAKQSI